MKEPQRDEQAMDSDSDSAPESVSFNESKSKNAIQSSNIKDQINKIRESQKKKRIERQEKYIEQKKTKYENLKLSNDILGSFDDQNSLASSSHSSSKMNKSIKIDTKVKSTKIPDSSEASTLKDTTWSDYIPLKSYSNYGINVVNLANINKKPLIGSDKAKAFKESMYNRPGIRRQNASESISLAKKRKYVK